jgi:hypothetical protein
MSRDEEGKLARLFYVRTIERNIRKGLTNRKDYDKYLKSLPDVAEKAAPPDALLADDSDLDDDLDDLDDDEDLDEGDEVAAANHTPSDVSNGTPSA